ncbi:MAG: hypothetical protein ACRDA5_08060 [Clostridium sp.]
MGIIYNENIETEEKFKNQDIVVKNRDNYNYVLRVVKESGYVSNFIDLTLDANDKEKYIEVEIDLINYMRVSGIVKYECGNVVKNAKMTLFRSVLINYRTEYIPVCDVITDENGRYEVVIDNVMEDSHYIVGVN